MTGAYLIRRNEWLAGLLAGLLYLVLYGWSKSLSYKLPSTVIDD